MRKAVKIIAIILASLLVALAIPMFIPIKHCLSAIPTDSTEDFYIIQYSRTLNRWVMLGDQNGLFRENETPKRFARPTEKGFGISDTLSIDLHMQDDSTIFIVYGTATIDEAWDAKYYGDTGDAILYTIDCTGWDILGEVQTMNPVRSIFPRKYLNIYDYRWFDVLRDRLFAYLDGQTYFD